MQNSANIRPARLSEAQYRENFSDICPALSAEQAASESARCVFCFDAPCIEACPTSIDVPAFIRKIHAGNSQGAAMDILDANILGGSCARVCPVETLCEEACVRNKESATPIQIASLQRFAIDNSNVLQQHPYVRKATTGKKVAIVGAGPAGLAAAHTLAREGHQLTIFEAADKAAGLNEYGIAKYKLPDDFAQSEVDFVLALGGIDMRFNQRLGDNLILDQLRNEHAAVLVAVGLGGVNSLGIEGENLHGVVDAVEYISDLRQARDLAQLPVAQNVVVIGGGMTAIDIAVQSKKLGAETVTLVYRRGTDEMGASGHEQQLALGHNIRIINHAWPIKISSEGDHCSAIFFERTRKDETGRLVGTGDQFELPADMIFKAIGQAIKLSGDLASCIDAGRLRTNDRFETDLDGVFSAGDCAIGQNLTVEAVAQGNQAALSIHQYLGGE